MTSPHLPAAPRRLHPLPPGTTPLDACGPDARTGVAAWLRWGVAVPEPGCGWYDPDTGVVALVRHRRAYGTGLVVVHPAGDPARVPDVVDAVLAVGAASGADFVTVERGPWTDALRAALPDLPPAAEWDWMWTTTAPSAVPGEDRVVPLGPDDHDEIAALLAAASPRHSAVPGEPAVRRWVGVRSGSTSGSDDGSGGRLVACGADYEAVPGVALLASIATVPAVRGQGLGAAVTARLTRDALAAGEPAVTLDLYADNPSARRLYERLGYALALEFSSATLPGRVRGTGAG